MAVQLANIFSDHMVLQQQKSINIWGTGESGESVTVIFDRQTVQTTVDEKKNWQVILTPMESNTTSNKLIVQGTNRIEIMDVLVGEVWFCSGQSNMVWTLSQIDTPTEELGTFNYPQIRVNTTQINKWELATPENAPGFSGAAFYFGKNLYEKINVPVGLIVRARGGSPIEPWFSREACLANPSTKVYLETADTAEIRKMSTDYSNAVQDYLKTYKEWEKATPEERKSMTSPIAPVMPELLSNWFGFLQVGNLYKMDVKPVIPFTIRGFLWYQGESNTLLKSSAIRYRELLPVLIQSWRKDWGDTNLPFYVVQLPNWPQGKFWP